MNKKDVLWHLFFDGKKQNLMIIDYLALTKNFLRCTINVT